MLCQQRLERPALQYGLLSTLDAAPAAAVFAFEAALPGEQLFAVVNMSGEPVTAEIPSAGMRIPLAAWSAEVREV